VLDPEVSDQLLVLDDVIKHYLSWENVLQTKETELNELREYAKDHDKYLLNYDSEIMEEFSKCFQMLGQWEKKSMNY
jgi:hypothetical protein